MDLRRRRRVAPGSPAGSTVGRRRALWTALGAATGYVVLSVLVGTHVTQRMDSRASAWFRPHDEWGRVQQLLLPVIDRMQPSYVFLLLVLVAAGTSLRRRSWRPGAYATLVVLAAVVVTLVTKFAFHRPDPHSDMSGVGGSYPSGHVLAVLVCLGGALLVVRQRTRWWQWLLVGSCVALMGAALLFTAAHWLTDVAGGSLLGAAVLAGASVLSLRSTTGLQEFARERRSRS